MGNNKYSLSKKLLSIALSVILLIGLLPVNTWAMENGQFVLVVESEEGLVIAPEYVTYSEGVSIGKALAGSGHIFTGLEDGWITEIDGVVGNYSRSDEDGSFDLSKEATEIQYYRFCENEQPTPSVGLQQLMTAMAVYKNKDDDVKAAAKEAYENAYNQFVGLDSDSAAVLAEALNDAMSQYENTLSGTKYSVSFTDGTDVYQNVSITVTNAYGKQWTDEGDGILSLPVGMYNFSINKDGLWAEGDFELSNNVTINAPLPKEEWLVLDNFRLSGSYEAQKEEDGSFADDEYDLAKWNGRTLTVAVSDTFTGTMYTYAEYDMNLLKELPQLTAVYTSAKTGEIVKQDIPFESLTSGTANILAKGAKGNSVIYRVSSVSADGYTYSQDYTVNYERIPSLTEIEVKDQNGVDQAATMPFDANMKEYTYKVLDKVTEVTVAAKPMNDSYKITVDGKDAAEGVDVVLNEDGITTISVVVTAGVYSNEYILNICPGEGKALSFLTSKQDVTLKVVNKNGQVMPYEKFKEGASGNRYQYSLVPGEDYSYVATVGNYYHVADEFTMEDAADSTIKVDVPKKDWLKNLSFGTGKSSKLRDTLPLDSKFESSDHEYVVEMVDTEHIPYIWVAGEDGIAIDVLYNQKFSSSLYHNKAMTKELTSNATQGLMLNRFLMDENPIENTVTVRLSKNEDGALYYQDYIVDFNRQLTLKNMSVKCENVSISLKQEMQEGTITEKIGFESDVKEYNVTVSMEAEELELYVERYTEELCYGEEEVGYTVEVDGKDITGIDKVTVALDGTLQSQKAIIKVKNEKAPNGTAEYILHILKSPPVETTFEISPSLAVLAIYEAMSGERLWPDENGNYSLCEGYKYEYALTFFEYITKSGTLEVTRDDEKALVIKDGETVYKVDENEKGGGSLVVEWNLEKAPINTGLRLDIESEWSNFRGNEDNNAVTDSLIPTAADEGVLYWANKIGSGYSADAVGSPIIVDGDIITYAGSNIYRVDTVTGTIKATGTMDHKSAHATTPPSYGNGMVFVALTDGTVQAFNADTLESLWIYKDPLGGQPVCPLTIHDGYLYTGFWNSESEDANFVCLTITDEKPEKTDETKKASWYYTSKGGFYWAGAYASSDYVIVGTDDGSSTCTNQTSKLLLFDTLTGRLLDKIEGLDGDIRSSVVYDKETDAYYFTSKGGSFYSVQVKNKDGAFVFANMWNIKLQNGTEGTPMSTCSPSVYNGRAYVGVSGAGQFSAYSGHNISIIDLTKKKIAYSVPTQGYPQTSGLLTTAYEDNSGYVYVYFFDNMTPGKLRVLRDKAGQTKADYLTTEGSFETAYALFTPTGEQAEYAICSPIVDEYGTIYFKNDSAHLMAFGSMITKIEVTKNPDKTVYAEGEMFDPTGMIVTATYANGKTRDVTEYVTYDLNNVTKENSVVTISFPYVMYQNEENGTSMTSGVTATTPVTTLTLTIGDNMPELPPSQPDGITMGDLNGDGSIDTIDASTVISYYYGKIDLDDEQAAAADVNGDGIIDTIDASIIISYYYGKIEEL